MKFNNRSFFSRFIGQIDWAFLVFLIGVVNIKLYLKALSVVLYFGYIIFRKYKLNEAPKPVLLFYLLMPILGIVTPLFDVLYIGKAYWFGYLMGLGQWLIAGSAFYLAYATIRNNDLNRIRKTAELFFTFNILISLVQLGNVMLASHTLMPYWLDDAAQRFGVSTGDYIYGITMSSSTSNAIISTMGAIYFIFSRRLLQTLACLLIMVLCTSNLAVGIAVLILLLILFTARKAVSIFSISAAIIFIVVTYFFISPDNIYYIQEMRKKYFSNEFFSGFSLRHGNHAVKRPKTKNKGNAKQAMYLKNDSNVVLIKQLHLTNDLVQNSAQIKLVHKQVYGLSTDSSDLSYYHKPGKIYSYGQLLSFLTNNPKNLLFGAGMGCFSSKLAIKMSGLGLQGQYPRDKIFLSPYYVQFHLRTIFYYLSLDRSLHSVINFPYSVYNQIGGEYGFLGLLAFFFLYLRFFWKGSRKNSYSLYLFFAILIFYNMDYCFEAISVTFIFELLMLLNNFALNNKDAEHISPGNSINTGI